MIDVTSPTYKKKVLGVNTYLGTFLEYVFRKQKRFLPLFNYKNLVIVSK